MGSRLNIRLSEEHRIQLEERAHIAGYPSACALARCVLVAFLRYQRGGSPYPREITAWIEEMGMGAEVDAIQRRLIKERIV